MCGGSLRLDRHGEIPKIVDENWRGERMKDQKINRTHNNEGWKNHIDKGLKILAIMAEKLEQKSAMKVDEERQMGSATMWEKMLSNFYLISWYHPTLYPIFKEKLKEIDKLKIPINQNNPYR